MIPDIHSFDKTQFFGLNPQKDNICTLEGSVPTGFEDVASDECKDKLQVNPVMIRGRIFFDIEISKAPQALKLRSIEHLYVVISVEPGFNFTSEREDCFINLYHLAEKLDLKKGVNLWQKIFNEDVGDPFANEQLPLRNVICKPCPETDLHRIKDSSLNNNLPSSVRASIKDHNAGNSTHKLSFKDEDDSSQVVYSDDQRRISGPKFRVSCNRTGSNHCFGSPEASRQFGGGINERFGWPVDLSNHQLEIILNINNDFVYSCISLTREPLFHRNISHFGKTTLKSTISHSLVYLAKPKKGDIILDHMCGVGSIPLEASTAFPHSFFLGGDIHPEAVDKTQKNITSLVEKGKSLTVDVAHWDATRLPLRSQSIDAVVSDMPFGKRCGSKFDNRVLYMRSLIEIARVTRISTGRAVLLTQDKKNMIRNLQKVSTLWKNSSSRTVNIGGLSAGVFLLARTSLVSDESLRELLSDRKDRKRKFDPTRAEPGLKE